MITEKDMQYVLTIANYGNLTKAANALFEMYAECRL